MSFDRLLAFFGVVVGLTVMVVFFMPWVKGTGSVIEPISDSTRRLWYLDLTGIIRVLVIGIKKLVDFVSVIIFRKKLVHILNGFQVPLLMYAAEGKKAYLLYAVPLSAIFYIWLNLAANRRRIYSLIAAIMTFVMYMVLYGQEKAFNHEELFINIKECWGFRATIYLFLAAAAISTLRLITFRHPLRDKIRMIIRDGRDSKGGLKLNRRPNVQDYE